MHSSGGNSRKRKNDSSKREEYRSFDEVSSGMREALVKSCAVKVIAHAAENGGRCRHGFVKEMVDKIFQRAPFLEITRDDINNKVRSIQGQREEEEQREVLPAIPFHIVRDPSLSTNSDLSVSTSSNKQNPLDILASQAIESEKMQLTLPNRCSYEECGAPLNLVPGHFSSCLRLVHPIFQQFSVGLGVDLSKLLCQVCREEEEEVFATVPVNFIASTTPA